MLNIWSTGWMTSSITIIIYLSTRGRTVLMEEVATMMEDGLKL